MAETNGQKPKDVPVVAPGTVVDHFKVLRLVAKGGMGQVYLARDTRLGRKVALKFVYREDMDQDRARERFMGEARATARRVTFQALPFALVSLVCVAAGIWMLFRDRQGGKEQSRLREF